MGRQLVAQVARGAAARLWKLLTQAQQFTGEVVNLLLLAIHGQVQLIKQIFGVAGLDLQIIQTVHGGGGILHGAIGTQSAVRGRNAAYRPSSG